MFSYMAVPIFVLMDGSHPTLHALADIPRFPQGSSSTVVFLFFDIQSTGSEPGQVV